MSKNYVLFDPFSIKHNKKSTNLKVNESRLSSILDTLLYKYTFSREVKMREKLVHTICNPSYKSREKTCQRYQKLASIKLKLLRSHSQSKATFRQGSVFTNKHKRKYKYLRVTCHRIYATNSPSDQMYKQTIERYAKNAPCPVK